MLALANSKQITEAIPLSVRGRERQHRFDHFAFIKRGAMECGIGFFNMSAHASFAHRIVDWAVPVQLIPLIIIILCNKLMV